MLTKSNLFNIPRSASYNPAIGTLRFLLAVYVVFFHAIPRYALYGHDVKIFLGVEQWLIKLFQGYDETNPAVLAFIVISGYCIHRNGLRLDYVQLKDFFIKRVLRIVPMLTIGMLLGIMVFVALQYDPRIILITNTQDITLTALLYKISGTFVFVPYKFEQMIHLGNGPLLTCIMEGWLYVCYPLGMWVIMRLGTERFILILCTMMLCGIRLCMQYPAINSWWHNGALFSFLLYWWIGAYAVEQDNKIYSYKPLMIIAYVGLSTVLLSNVHSLLVIELRKIMLALLIASVLRWSEEKQWSISQTITAPSYSIYVLHIPLLCLALHFGINMYAAITLIILSSYFTYKYVEKPCMKLAKMQYKDQLATVRGS